MKTKKTKKTKKAKSPSSSKRRAANAESAFRPCDDYIDDPTVPDALRKYLAFARAPAHGLFLPKPHPTLFADHEGQRVRVTMASTMGDVGFTTDLSRELGYDRRVAVSQLSNFSEVPASVSVLDEMLVSLQAVPITEGAELSQAFVDAVLSDFSDGAEKE